jgi:hypothetical protein
LIAGTKATGGEAVFVLFLQMLQSLLLVLIGDGAGWGVV